MYLCYIVNSYINLILIIQITRHVMCAHACMCMYMLSLSISLTHVHTIILDILTAGTDWTRNAALAALFEAIAAVGVVVAGPTRISWY